MRSAFPGVRGLANDLEVRLPSGSERYDPEIARDAVAALKGELPYSSRAYETHSQERLGHARRVR